MGCADPMAGADPMACVDAMVCADPMAGFDPLACVDVMVWADPMAGADPLACVDAMDCADPMAGADPMACAGAPNCTLMEGSPSVGRAALGRRAAPERPGGAPHGARETLARVGSGTRDGASTCRRPRRQAPV